MEKEAPRLSRKRIVDAALKLADTIGVDGLSMRKIAGELNVKAMSLYNHVSNKDDILDELVERVVAEIDIPDANEDWKTAMLNRARSAHSVLLRHPWAIQTLMTRSTAGPVKLRYIDATLACLIEAGFSYETADHIWNAMDNHIYGYTLQEINFPFSEDEYSDSAKEFLPQITEDDYPYFTTLAKMVLEKRYDGLHSIEFGMKLILDGLEGYLASNDRTADGRRN